MTSLPLQAESLEDKQAIVVAHFNDPSARDPNSPAAKAAREKHAAALEKELGVLRTGAKIEKRSNGTFVVKDAAGREIATAFTQEAAMELKRDYDANDAEKAEAEKQIEQEIARQRDDAFWAAEQQAAWEAETGGEGTEEAPATPGAPGAPATPATPATPTAPATPATDGTAGQTGTAGAGNAGAEAGSEAGTGTAATPDLTNLPIGLDLHLTREANDRLGNTAKMGDGKPATAVIIKKRRVEKDGQVRYLIGLFGNSSGGGHMRGVTAEELAGMVDYSKPAKLNGEEYQFPKAGAGAATEAGGQAAPAPADGSTQPAAPAAPAPQPEGAGQEAPTAAATPDAAAPTAAAAPGAAEPGGGTTILEPTEHPVRDVPVDQIVVNKDIPQFKENADKKTGVVEKLTGSYQRLGTAPIVLWEKENGELEVITGRHRLDLARRSGEKTIPAQIVREKDGFTRDRAVVFDAESNIRDGQGTVKDFAQYFRASRLGREEAEARGLLRGAKASAGFALGAGGTDRLFDLYANGEIAEGKAVAIARGAPGNEAAQASVLKDADRLSAQMLELSVRNFSLINNTPVVRAGDQLGFASMGGDFAEFERQAKAIAKVQNERINERTEMIKAAGNAAKYPAAARKMGLPVDNPDALKQRVAELEAEVARLRNPDADLFRELAKEAGVKLPEAAAPAGAAQQGGELFGNETPFNLSGETQPAQETAEDKPLPDTGTMEMFGDETRSTPPTEMDRQNEANRDQTKGMPAAGGQRPANRLGIGKSKEDLTPAERAAEQRFTDEMNGRSDRENDELYDRQEGAAGGRVWNTDAARRMAKGEGATSRATQEAAGKYVRDRFYREMAKPVKKDGETITFLAGGPGSGKTSSLPDGFKGRVFDTTLSNPEEAGRMIEAALKSGRNVKIVYTHRPVEAAADLAFARAADKSSPDYGRVMGVEYFGKAHHNSQKTIQALAGKYKGDNRVEIEVWDNSGGKGSNRLAAEGVDFFGKEGISYDNDIDSTVRRAKEGFRRNRRGDNGEPLADDTGNAGTREAGKQGVAPADGRAAEGTGGGGEAGGAGQGQGNNPVGGGAGVGVPSAEERRQYDAVVAQWTKRDGTKKPGWMKAPNGKDTNLTELQWVHVRTPSFKRWFGDWENDPANASKVLDENGEPLVLYHGTPASFSVFDNSKGKSNTNAYGADKGFFFTSSRDVAMTYATRGGQVAGREPMAVFLRILNPYRYDLPNRPNQGYGAAIAERVYAVKKYFTGYDGLVSYNVTDPFEVSDVYAVFDNTAIKSATGNSGAYSRDNANIYGAPLQLTQPNPPAVNFDRPPDVRPGAGVNAPKTIMAFSAVVQSVGGSGAIRVGKLKKRKTLGEFWTFAATARVRIANDVGTAAHELAHALDQALFGRGNNWDGKTGGGGLSKPAQGELEKLGRDAYAGQKAPVGGYRSEGFAEFIRLSLTDPAQAAAKAPEFQKWWESQVVAKNHRLASALQEARAMGTLWFRQGSEERMRQQLAGPKTVQEKLAELKASRNKKLMEFERKFIEGAVFLRDFVNQAQAKAGGKIDEENNPYLTLTARRLTADSKARYMALRGMIDFWGNPTGGKALVDAFNRAGGEEKAHDFVLYLWARRALSLWDDPNGPRNPGIDREDAEYFMRKYDSPDFAAAAQMVYDWNNAVLDYSAQASPAYKRVVGFIRARDPGNYIPLFREFQELDNRYAGARAGGVRGNDLLKRLKGSGRRIKPPVESMIAQAKTIILKADQIHVLEQAIAITENVEGMGHLLQEVSRDTIRQLGPTIESAVNAIDKKLAEIGAGLRIEQGTATTDEIMALAEESLAFFAKAVMPKNGEYGYIPMWRDGKVRWYEIEKGLYETLAVMDTSPVPFGGVGRVLNVAARTKRLGTTALRASFSFVTNPMRDFRTLYYNTRASDNPAVIFANWFGSFFSLAVNTVSGGKLFADNVFIKYKDVFDRLGLEMSGSLTQDARPVSRAAARVMRGGKLSLAPWKLASYGDYYDILLHVFQFGESAARVAEMKMVAQNMGWDPSQPMTPRVAAHLANAAKEVTTDFTKAGTFARQWNMLVPFINANIQGKVAHYEAIKRKGVAMWFFTRGLNLMLLSAANWWFNKDEEWWREMGEQERFSNDFVQTGDVLWRFPRAFEIDGFFLGGTAAILDAWYAREPERVREWFGLMFEQMSVVGSTKTGLNLDTLPPAAKEALEQAANYDTWRGRRIIPRMEEDRPAEEQYNEYTTRAAIEAGNILGVSPRRIDHMVNGVAGGVFSDATAIFGRGDEIMGSPVDREWEAADIPVFGRLFQRGGAAARNPVSIDKLYDAYGNALERQKSVKHEETEDERENRLGLTNAVRAIGNLEVIRMGTPDRKKRNELASLQIKIARTAVAASKGGKLDSWDYKTEAAEYKEAADEIKEARKAKRKAGGERR